MYIAADSPQHYFEQVPPERQEPIAVLRALIRSTFPQIKENLERDIPSYHLNGQLVFALANQKHFIVLHIFPYDLLGAFKKELLAYNHGKSCIRVRHLDEATLAFMDRVVKYVGTTFTNSRMDLKRYVRA